MGVDIKVETEEFLGNEDRRWMALRKGYDTAMSGTLDVSSLHTDHWISKGWVPSGLALVKSGGLWVPYNSVADVAEVQSITRTSTGGTFTLNLDGEVTGNIDASAAVTAAVIQAAINLLSNVDEEHTATVTGAAGGPFAVTFGGLWAGEDMPQMISGGAPTGGTVTIGTTTAGVPAHTGTDYGLLFSSTKAGLTNTGSDKATAADVGIAVVWEGMVNQNFLPTFVTTKLGLVDANFRAHLPLMKWIGTDLV